MPNNMKKSCIVLSHAKEDNKHMQFCNKPSVNIFSEKQHHAN